jgi:leucyl/phenylalanyl-tRNA--protein transferase
MSTIDFPNPLTHKFPRRLLFGRFYFDARDIIYLGGEMTLENLRRAYKSGIFPWAIEGLPLPWFCPERRAILEFDKLHIPRSLRKQQKKSQLTFTIDRAFAEVIESCARIKRAGENGTWITEEFIRSYTALHRAGDAHSVEVWSAQGSLIGGLYGVDAGGVFCGESMFHRQTGASKLALLFLIEYLRKRGATWLDVQVLTPHLAMLGAVEIERAEFIHKLKQTLALNLKLF